MAIYSLNLGFISRSEGRSAVGFSAYISGGRHQDERTGVLYNYGCKDDVIVSRILAPDDAPEWVKNSSILWNKMELLEDDYASLRFRGDPNDPEKNKKSLNAKEQFLASAQPAQTILGALPIEFSEEEAEVYVEDFLKTRFVSRGLVVEYAIHWQRGNPHFHGMITRRPFLDGEFSIKKDREVVSRTEHNITRKQWEVVVNKHLELGGYESRIDCRSNADRGSLFLPLAHEGWYAQRLSAGGQYSRIVADNEVLRQKNIEILCENPEALIQEVALKRTTFTRKHIEDEIIRRVGGDEKLFSLLKAKVNGIGIPSELILKQANDNMVFEGISNLNSFSEHDFKDISQMRNEIFATQLQGLASRLTSQLLENKDVAYKVGENINRNRVFTSAAYKKQEEKLIKLADMLHEKQSKVVSEDLVSRAIENSEKEFGFALSEEQRAAITHLCSGPDIRLLNGKAGTGKTTLLKAVAFAYQEQGYRVLGTSFQGKAVEIMEQEIGIPCKTLDSFDYAWTRHQTQKDLVESGTLWGRPYIYAFNRMKELEKQRLTSRDVVIVDEANMIAGRLWELFLEEAAEKGAKVLIVQDMAQIKSRDPGDYGRLFANRFGFYETKEVVRQRISWQRACSKYLNDHHLIDGLKPYYEKGHLKWFEDSERLHQTVAQDYVKEITKNPHKTYIALAYRNAEVYKINQCIRQVLKDNGSLKHSFKIKGEEYAIGDRVRFTLNDHYGRFVQNRGSSLDTQFKGVKNGSFGIIESYDETRSLLTVLLDGNTKRRVQFNTREYHDITYGYAMGVHKSEASTFDGSFLIIDPRMDPETILVGMTRHRDDVRVYINQEHFTDFKDLVDQLGRFSFKDNLQDYCISEEQKPYFARVQQYRDLMGEASTLREEMEGNIDSQTPLFKHPFYKAFQICFEEKKRVAETILKDWQNHAPYVRLAGIRRDVLEVEAGLRPRLLSDLEHRASIQVQGYMDLVKQTRDLWKTISETHPGVLAKSHTLYENYKELKAERDSLAAVFQENLKLYTPFLKFAKSEYTDANTGISFETYKNYWGEDVTKEDRVFINSIKSQAEAHFKSQMHNLYYERLNPDQKIHYDFVKSYVDTRNETASIYSHLQKQKEAVVQVTPPESFLNIDKFHELQARRDALALKIVESPEKYQVYFDLLKVKEEKLLEHAISGEVREKVQDYILEKDMAKRAFHAQELKRILTSSKDYRLVKESTKESKAVDLNRLTFDIAFYEKIKCGEILPTVDPDQVYKPIQSYLNATKESTRLWKMIQVNVQENKDLLKKDYQFALSARNENARALKSDQVALSVISGMKHGIENQVIKHASFIQRNISPTNRIPNKSLQLTTSKDLTPSFLSFEQVLEAAKGQYESIAMDLLGTPNKHMGTKTTLRFGKKGSFVINISGPKEGLWKDFESGEGGNIFKLIQREKSLDFKEAVTYWADMLNVRVSSKVIIHPQTFSQAQRSSEKISLEKAKEIASRLNAVLELHIKSKPIEGTLAETYLRKEREISSAYFSNDLRYLSKGTQFIYKGARKTLQHDCFAAFGRNHEGCLSSVQLTKLNGQGKRALTFDGEKLNKLQYGIAKGSFVLLQEGSNKDLVFIAEGVETALSIKEANVNGKIVASLGIHNISNYQGPEKEIIICADNDEYKPNSQTHRIIEKTQAQFNTRGKTTTNIKPFQAGDDFNDVLKKQGTKGVQQYVKEYLAPEKQSIQRVSEKTEQKLDFINKPETKDPTSKIEKISPISLESLFKYMEAKLKEVKALEGSTLAYKSKAELNMYIQLLDKGTTTMQKLRHFNPDLARDIESYVHGQNRSKTIGKKR